MIRWDESRGFAPGIALSTITVTGFKVFGFSITTIPILKSKPISIYIAIALIKNVSVEVSTFKAISLHVKAISLCFLGCG